MGHNAGSHNGVQAQRTVSTNARYQRPSKLKNVVNCIRIFSSLKYDRRQVTPVWIV